MLICSEPEGADLTLRRLGASEQALLPVLLLQLAQAYSRMVMSHTAQW